MWKKVTDRPEIRKAIIIMCDNHHIMHGYMNTIYFPGENFPTYTFHGTYYDFAQNKIVYCLVNAIAWMEIPELPKGIPEERK